MEFLRRVADALLVWCVELGRALFTRRQSCLPHSRRGVASIEMALASTFVLVPLCACISDVGIIIVTWSQINDVENAVLTYAWANPTASASNLQSAAAAVWSATSPTLTVRASHACYCVAPTGTRQSGTAASCSGSCTGSQVLANFVTVSLSTSVTLALPLPGVSSPYAVSTTATVRVL